MQMHLHVAGEQYDYHFFRFQKAHPDPLTFDLAPCYSNRRRRNFDFAVSSKYTFDFTVSGRKQFDINVSSKQQFDFTLPSK